MATVQRNNILQNMPDLGVTVTPAMIRDGAISHGALRLWLLMRSMPATWRPTIGGFGTILRRRGMSASYDTVSRWCRELKASGYLTIVKTFDIKHRWNGWAWATYPIPRDAYLRALSEHSRALGVAP